MEPVSLKKMHYLKFSGLFAIVFFLSCALNDQNRWDVIKDSESVVQYKNFLDKYPESPYAVKAKKKIEFLEYSDAIQKDEISIYEKFTEKYPSSDLTKDVINRVHRLEWKALIKSDDEHEYTAFLAANPNSIFKKKAEENLHNLRWQKACRENSIKAFNQFIKQYPESIVIEDVKARLNRLLQRFRKIKIIFSGNVYANLDPIKTKMIEDAIRVLKAAGLTPYWNKEKQADGILKIEADTQPIKSNLFADKIYSEAKTAYTFTLSNWEGEIIHRDTFSGRTYSYSRLLFRPNESHYGGPFEIHTDIMDIEIGHVYTSIYKFKKHYALKKNAPFLETLTMFDDSLASFLINALGVNTLEKDRAAP
jgi:uncharacterized coiled-coil protein SlyX